MEAFLSFIKKAGERTEGAIWEIFSIIENASIMFSMLYGLLRDMTWNKLLLDV